MHTPNNNTRTPNNNTHSPPYHLSTLSPLMSESRHQKKKLLLALLAHPPNTSCPFTRSRIDIHPTTASATAAIAAFESPNHHCYPYNSPNIITNSTPSTSLPLYSYHSHYSPSTSLPPWSYQSHHSHHSPTLPPLLPLLPPKRTALYSHTLILMNRPFDPNSQEAID